MEQEGGGIAATGGAVFAHLYARAGSDASSQKVLAILDALKETIATELPSGKKGGKKANADEAPPTAYFAALMTALERTGAEHAREVFFLLSVLLPHVPAGVLRAKYGPIAAVFAASLKAPAVIKEAAIMRPLLACMGVVLRAQDPTVESWARPEVVRTLSALLSFAVDPRPKVRKAAQTAALDVLTAHYTARSYGSAAGATSFFCEALRATSQKDTTRLLQLLPLLRAALPLLPTSSLAPVCELLLSLTTAGQPRLTVAALGVAATLAESPRARLSIKFVSELTSALTSRAAPSPDDHASSAEYAYALAAAVTRLASMEKMRSGGSPEVSLTFPRAPQMPGTPNSAVPASLALALVPVVTSLVANFASDRIGVHHATANALAVTLTSGLEGGMIGQALTWAAHGANGAALAVTADTVASAPALPPSAPVLLQVLTSLEGLLHIRYQHSWPTSLPVLGLVLRLLGPSGHPLANRLVASLMALRATVAAVAADSGPSVAEEDEAAFKRSAKRRRRGGGGGGGKVKDEDEDDDANSDADGDNEGGDVTGDGSAGRGAQAAAVLRVITRLLATAVRTLGAHRFVPLAGGFTADVSVASSSSSAKAKPTPSALAAAGSHASAGVPDERAWLLPLLRDNAQYAPVPLEFFMSTVLPAIRSCEAAAAAATASKLPRNAKVHMLRAAQLWALLPPLCAAPPDLTSAFNAQLGKILTSALGDATRYPEAPTVIGRALETLIVRNRAAVGLPAISASYATAGGDNDDEEDGYGSDGDDGEAALTVAGGKGAKQANKKKSGGSSKKKAADDDEEEHDSDDDEEDDDDDENEDGGAGSVDGGGSVEGGATVVFGAGGVSVYAGGDSGDPRHPLLADVMKPRNDALPPISKEAAKANLAVVRGYARNYLPILLNLYETTVLGTTPSTATTTTAAASSASQPTPQLSGGASAERGRKVLDAITAYLSISPVDQAGGTAERLYKLLVTAAAAVASADQAVLGAKEAHRVAEAAAAKGQPSRPTSETGAALAAAIKAAASTAARLCSLLSLALAVVATLPPVSPVTSSSASDPWDEAKPAPGTPSFLCKLYKALRPSITDDAHPAVQKRAYGLLAAMLAHHPSWGRHPSRVPELTSLLSESLMTVSASARRGRLVCLRHLVKCLDIIHTPAQAALIPSLLGETMLCCKDSNGKVRAAAFALLAGMAKAMAAGGDGAGIEDWQAAVDGQEEEEEGMDDEDEDDDEEGGNDVARALAAGSDDDDDASGDEVIESGAAPVSLKALARKKKGTHVLAPSKKVLEAAAAASSSPSALPPPTLTEFFRMVLGGLGAATPHMRSAALLALSRLVYDWAHRPVVHSLLPALLDTSLLLLKEKSREVAKAVVGFVKVVVSCMPPQELGPHVGGIVTALLGWSGESKNRIRLKIKAVVTRLVRKYGWEEVAQHVPDSDQALMAHMKKQADKKARKKAAARALAQAAAGGGGAAGEDGATAISRGGARTAFEDLAGDSDDDGDEDSEDARTRMTAASVARSWGVVGSRLGGGGGGGGPSSVAPTSVLGGGNAARSSRMTAITTSMRAGSQLLATAPLPAPGAVLSTQSAFMDAKQRKIARKMAAKSVVAGGGQQQQSVAGGAKRPGGSVAASSVYKQPSSSSYAGAGASLLRADDDAPLDLLDASGLALSARTGSNARAAARANGNSAGGRGGLKVASDGRLVIASDKRKGGDDSEDDEDDAAEAAQIRDRSGKQRQTGGKGKHQQQRGRGGGGGGDADEDEDLAPSSSKRGGGGGGGSSGKSAMTAGSQGWGMKRSKIGFEGKGASGGGKENRFSGSSFKGQGGAKGDVKRKDARFEPFAYVPLDAKAMSGKHGSKAVARFSGVMESTSKSARAHDKRGGERADQGSSGGRVTGGKRKR